MRILVAEDDTRLADLLARSLRESGYAVDVTADGDSAIVQAAVNPYDAIILDTDNGPTPLVQRANARLYDDAGLKRIQTALKPSGRAVIWSATPDRAYAARLAKAGFKVEVVAARVHATAKRAACTLYVADKTAAA